MLGVPVILTPTWVVFAVTLVLLYEPVVRTRLGDSRAYLVAGGLALMLLASVLLHEIGHCVVARAFGLPVRSITVSFLGGFTEITEAPPTPSKEYAVAVSGPMVSVLLTGIAVAAMGAFPDGSLAHEQWRNAAVINGVIAAFNLLPGLPLDGGRVLRAIVWGFNHDPAKATRVSARAGMGVALLPILFAWLTPVLGLGALDVFTIVASSLVSGFVFAQASAALRHVELVSRLPLVSVASIARPALAVPATLPLAEAVRQAHELNLRALVVVDGNGRIEGVVSESWVRQVPLERRPWVVVADGARRVEPGLVLDADLFGEELVAMMRATPASEYVVPGVPPRVLVSGDVAAAMQA